MGFGLLKGDPHTGLGGQVVQFLWLGLPEEAVEATGVTEVSVVEDEDLSLFPRSLAQRLDTLSIELRGPPHHPMDLVAFREQQFRQVGSILSGDAGDQCDQVVHAYSSC